jgi:hypothetical protein
MFIVRICRHLVDQGLDVLGRQHAEQIFDVDVGRIENVAAEV